MSVLVIKVELDESWLETHKHNIVGAVEFYVEDKLDEELMGDEDAFDVGDFVSWDME
jgi:hypothetical protein